MKYLLSAIVLVISLNAKVKYIADSSFHVSDLSSGDSVLFKRGERYFTNINLFKNGPDNVYFGSYGDSSLEKPLLDGSIYHFGFDSAGWTDFEIIKGIKFYKKSVKDLDQVENVYAGKEILAMAREPDEDETVVTGQRNSFTGFFMIDSVDINEPKKIFYDIKNIADWTGADVVAKTQQWSYEIRRIKKTSKGKIELEKSTQDQFRKNWGYFIQRHFDALDSEGEWFYDEKNGVLYFSPVKDKCIISISSNKEEENSGFDLKNKKNIRIEDLIFANFKHGIKLESCSGILIADCHFYNCIYGIINKKTLLDKITVKGCIFKNMKSYGIRLLSTNSEINGNIIDSVGLSLSCESRGYNNLDAIEVFGDNNNILGNKISNVGFCGIRFNGHKTRIERNTVSQAGLIMADVGGLYTWHSMDGNKKVRKNIVKGVRGNVSGTTGEKDHGTGIYLDELSLHFRVDSNEVSDCGGGIYIQNSRSDTVTNNRTYNNSKFELLINHAGTILNGGRLNPENYPEFYPDDLDSIPKGYVWDKEEGLLYFKNKKNGIVYVKPGNNIVSNNVFIPDPGRNKFSFQFSTWQNLTDNLVTDLTGNKDFFFNNIPDSLVKNASLFIHGSNVKDLRKGGDISNKIKNDFDIKRLNFLRQIKFWIGWGIKNDTENEIK